jgi:hypothetical protein
MPFTVSGQTSDGKVVFRRDTAVEAVLKATEMINAGTQDVYITDWERGRIYRREEFPGRDPVLFSAVRTGAAPQM